MAVNGFAAAQDIVDLNNGVSALALTMGLRVNENETQIAAQAITTAQASEDAETALNAANAVELTALKTNGSNPAVGLLANIGAVPSADLADDTGAGLVGYTPPGSGGVPEPLSDYLARLPVRPESYGAIGDGIANDRTAMTTAVNLAASTGRPLELKSDAVYNLGDLSSSVAVFFLNSPSLVINGNGALLKVNTTITAITNLFIFEQPRMVSVNDVRVQDTGYDAVDFVNLKGVVAFRASATNVQDSGNVTLKDCSLDGGISLLIIDGVDQTKRLKNVRLLGRCSTNNTYYGINCQGQGDDLSGSLTCVDVRRAYIGYGNNGVSLDFDIGRTASMTGGSTALINITSNTEPGSVQTETKNIVIRATCSGLMDGYTAIAGFQLLSDTTTASIKGCKVLLNLKGATSAPTNSVSFRSFSIAGVEVVGGGAATGVYDDITLSGDLSIAPISIPATQAAKGKLWLSNGAEAGVQAVRSSVSANFNLGYKDSYTPVWTGGSPSIGNGDLVGSYVISNGLCYTNIYFSGGPTTNYGSSAWAFSLPFPCNDFSVGMVYYSEAGVGFRVGACIANPGSSSIAMTGHGDNGETGPTRPFSWDAGDVMRVSLVYPV